MTLNVKLSIKVAILFYLTECLQQDPQGFMSLNKKFFVDNQCNW